jgi:PAS domain S-box-containing protein
MDENGTIILVNDAFCNMVGLTRNQLEGAHLSILFHKSINEIADPDLKNSKMEIYKQRFFEKKIEPKFERALNLWDGRKVWFEVTNAYMEIEGGKSVLLSIFRDITERKQAEIIIQQQNNRLQELNASKDRFFSIIAHDLKSPFNGLLNLTALMADTTEKISLDEFAEYSKMLNKAARNIYVLLNNLLEWAQIQKGTIQFTPTDFYLSKLVSQSIDTISHRALQKQIEIINETSNSQKVYADEKIINTVLRNLLSNAIKFTRTGGKVIVKSKRFDEGTIQVSIEDNGVGISEDNVKKLFRIDEKIGSIGTEGEPSTGLGLLLCKEFVEMHGQKIWVESEKKKGSTFYFTLQEEN